MSSNYKARLARDDEQQELPPYLRAPFLATLQCLYPHDDDDDDDGAAISKKPWGFVVYRLAGYGDEGLWAAFRERWDGIVGERLGNYEGVPGVAEAVQQVEFRWVEERELEGAGLGSVARYVCLYALDFPTPIPPNAHEIMRASVTQLKIGITICGR